MLQYEERLVANSGEAVTSQFVEMPMKTAAPL